MARGRFIAETVAKDARLNSLSIEAELVYLLTIPHLDRDGMIEGDPDILWGTVCPKRRQFLDTMAVYVQEWANAGLVVCYDTTDGVVLWFRGFAKNQMGMRYEREAASRFPTPPGFVRTNSGIVPESSHLEETPMRSPSLPPDPNPYQRPPAPGEYIPGVALPRHRRQYSDLSHIAKQRDAVGLTAAAMTALVDALLGKMNARGIADLDTDMGADELRQAQEAILALAGLGHKTVDQIETIYDTWFTHDWRGQKGEPPSYKLLVEHAKGMQTKIAAAAKLATAAPKLSAEERERILAAAKAAKTSIATAEKFRGTIQPQWQAAIDRAREVGVL